MSNSRAKGLRHLTGTPRWSPDRKRCCDGSFSWNDINWPFKGRFSNKNARVPPVKIKHQILDLYKPLVEWLQRSPDLTFINTFLLQPGRQVARATIFWKRAFNIFGVLSVKLALPKPSGVKYLEVTPQHIWITCVLWGFLKKTTCTPFDVDNTDVLHLTTGICSEKYVVRRFRRCANVCLHKPR